MSAGPDGSIIVDTELDPDGFKAGSTELKGALKSLSEQMKGLGPTLKQAMGGAGGALRSFKTQAQTLEGTIAELEADLKTLGSSRVATDDFKKLSADAEKAGLKLEQLLNRQERMQAMGVSENSAQWKTLAYDLDLAARKYDQLVAAKARMQADGTAYISGAQTAQYAQMEQSLSAAKARLAEMKSEVSSANGLMKRLTSSARSFTSHITHAARTIGGKLITGIKQATSNMAKMVTNARMMKQPLKNMSFLLRRIAPSLLMTEGLFGLLRKAVNAFLQQNEHLSAQLNACWSGIGNILGPIITRLINLVATAVAYVTQFLALLGFVGKSTTKAISSAGGSAKKETDKLKRQLASFDELNILHDNEDDGGGGGGTTNPDEGLPEVTLPDWVQTIVDHLKAGNWSAAAVVLTDQLNAMVNSVNWAGIGNSIAYGLNGALEFLATAITTFDWYNLGASLGTLINNIIYGVDWSNLGIVLGWKFIALIEGLGGLFATIDWPALGKALADSFMGLWNAIDWKQAAKTLSTGIIGVFNSLSSAIKNVDWKKLGSDVATYIANIDWSGIATAMFDGLGAALGGLAAFLIAGLLQGISDAWSGITEFFSTAVASLSESLSSGWESIKSNASTAWSNIKSTVTDAWQGIKSTETYTAVKDGVSSAWANVKSWSTSTWSGVKTAVSSAWDSVKSKTGKISTDVSNTASKAWSKVKNYVTKNLTDAKADAQKNWDHIRSNTTSSCSNIASVASSGWTKIKSNIAASLNSTKATATSTWNSVKSTVSTATSNISSTVSSKFSNVLSTVKSKVSTVRSTVASGFESARQSITSKMQSAMSTVKNQNWYSVGSNICSGIRNGINAGWSWLSSTVSNLARNLLNSAKRALGIRSPSRLFRDAVGLNIGYGIGAGIEKSEKSVLGSVVGVADAIADEFNAGEYEAAHIIPTTEINGALSTFADKITSGFTDLLDKLQAIADKVTFVTPVAASSLTPYATSGAVAGTTRTGSVFDDVSTEKLISLLTQLLTNQTAAIVSAIQTYSGTTINLDADSLTTMVIEEINRRTRMSGKSPLLT